MNDRSQEKIFLLFHYTLAFVVLALSIETIRHSLSNELSTPNLPMIGFAGLEAVAAILFMIPRTLKFSGYLLIVYSYSLSFFI